MWDYDENKLKKTESGRVKILEIDSDKKKFLKYIIWAK